jgi:F-type H+-transporting ATPase subunit gamma
MPSLKSIRTRIASVKSTQKITRAMKLVSAARLRRAQDAILGARPYANALADAVSEVALRAGDDAHQLLEKREPVGRVTIVPLTSDRGLAGGFNANIFRAVQRFIAERSQATPPVREFALEVVGKKGRDYFRRRKLTINHDLPGPTADTVVARASEVAHIVTHAFKDGRTDAVFLVYNEFKSAVQQRVVVEQLLPIVPANVPARANAAAGVLDFAYEPTKERVLDTLLPLYVQSQLYRGLLESMASELGARMTAMDNATGNAKEMISTLTLQYNRARQAAITKELMEIVSGAEALKG